ncbi:MAG: PD-(D/E)XK nuclease family protein [Cyclobacteriaceae bacterium]|nr:PD-(D/E)XK nuclease family protein [Cyclobacteriaceae bacterium]
MNSFLHDTAQTIISEYPKPEALTLVFPNRRAILHFRKHFSELISKPVFAPRMLTIEEFIAGYSPLREPDQLELVHRLFQSYQQIVKLDEPFDKFYFWGEMLLRDFNEVDKYLVDATLLFRDLSQQKELDAVFDYLTEEQRQFLMEFWGNFKGELTLNKQKFLQLWRHLADVYLAFRQQLKASGLAYEGMIHRALAEQIETFEVRGDYAFIGFNALTKAEEIILSYFAAHGARLFWDLDDYYVNNKIQEAGEFFREYQQHPVLGKTFPSGIPSNFRNPKSIRVIGAAQPIGQAKIMSQLVSEQLGQGMKPEETLIVLPDEKLLMPVLHGISGVVDKLNVTMGYSLTQTPLFSLVELLIELQERRRGSEFSFRAVLGILNHPYGIAPDPDNAARKRHEIVDKNWIRIPSSFLASGNDLYRTIFQQAAIENCIPYLRDVMRVLGSLPSLSDFDKEYVWHFIKALNRLDEIVGSTVTDWSSFLRLFKQYMRSMKIPFSGEPLQGLQVMGMLETRNLDFKNVFLLSLNEGALPSAGGSASYIPYNIRKAYHLPTVEHKDAMYAYLFYRVLQRAENVHLFYNTETDLIGQGEMSRFLQQLIFESGMPVTMGVLHNAIKPAPGMPISIPKDESILEALRNINRRQGDYGGFSPSALNNYIECRLRFFFQNVMRIREAKEVEEEVDARMMGEIVHNVLEKFYQSLAKKKQSNLVIESDFSNFEETVEKLLEAEIRRYYHINPDKELRYEGQLKLVRDVVHKFINQIISRDMEYTPFTMEGSEQKLWCTLPVSKEPGEIIISGIIDRIDRKDDLVRIVDYKTGRDKLEFKSVEELFDREIHDHPKAAFQTLLYAWMYKNATGEAGLIQPGLMNMRNLFSEDFRFGLVMKGQRLEEVNALLPEFEVRLRELMEEIYNPEVPFDQTTNLKNCSYCDFARICHR